MIRGILSAVVLLGIGVILYVKATGLSALPSPGAIEGWLAGNVRRLAIPAAYRSRSNPVASSPEGLADGLAHFADHCASCHANDGSGNTEMGRNLFPKAPDMRLPGTQTLTDGELFYLIEHGVRFTGMPGWSTGTAAGEQSSWQLVHVIRRLPQLSPEELERMASLNPRSPREIRQEIEEERFLRGETP